MVKHMIALGICALPLGGCVAGMAAGAVDLAVRSAQGKPDFNEHLQPNATNDCTAQAAHYGTVHVIDVEQRSPSKIIVWGTVADGKETRSFECDYGTKVTGFKLRTIKPRT